jgi:hypothetical protein
MKVVALDIFETFASKANESLHPRVVFQYVEIGLRNSVKRLKDWHETMLEHKKCTR